MDKVPDTVGKLLDELGQRFGATGSHLWQSYVHYLAVEGALSVAGYGFLALVAALLALASWSLFKKCQVAGDRHGGKELGEGSLFCAVAALVLMVIATTGVVNSLTEALAPEGYAIQSMVAKLK